jgi:hypothetical protein
VFTNIDQDVVRLRLSAEARPCCAESCVVSVLATVPQYGDNVSGVARSHDDLRNEAIRAGVGRVTDKVNGSMQNLVSADQFTQRFAQLPLCSKNALI